MSNTCHVKWGSVSVMVLCSHRFKSCFFPFNCLLLVFKFSIHFQYSTRFCSKHVSWSDNEKRSCDTKHCGELLNCRHYENFVKNTEEQHPLSLYVLLFLHEGHPMKNQCASHLSFTESGFTITSAYSMK